MCPLRGSWPAVQPCALTGNRTSDPLVYRPALNPLSCTSQGRRLAFLQPENPTQPLCGGWCAGLCLKGLHGSSHPPSARILPTRSSPQTCSNVSPRALTRLRHQHRSLRPSQQSDGKASVLLVGTGLQEVLAEGCRGARSASRSRSRGRPLGREGCWAAFLFLVF